MREAYRFKIGDILKKKFSAVTVGGPKICMVVEYVNDEAPDWRAIVGYRLLDLDGGKGYSYQPRMETEDAYQRIG